MSRPDRLRVNAHSKLHAEHDGEPWSDDELEWLHSWDGTEPYLHELAEVLGRTIEACREQFYKRRRTGSWVHVERTTTTTTLWYSSERIFEPDDLADIAWVGGVPDDERDCEEGIEALPRSVIRTTAGYWATERQEETLPDLEELWDHDQDKPVRREREREAVAHIRRSIFSGDPVTPRCPDCQGQCVYNGNYFCIQCEWALPEYELLPSPSREWLHKWFEEAYASLMDYRAQR